MLPEWVVYVATVVLALLMAELGYRAGLFLQRRTDLAQEASGGAAAAAALGLLAFLLAFVMSMAVGRFDNRRQLVIEEANAIGTTYLRAGFLPEPLQTETRTLLAEYVDVRLAAIDEGSLAVAIVRSEEIQEVLWSSAETMALSDDRSTIMPLYIDALNNMIDVHGKRKAAALTSRIPPTIILGIYIITALNMALVGYNSSFDKRRNWVALIGLSLVFAVVILLIVDLDRSTEGLLRVGQGAMQDLQLQFEAAGY
jgi:hypothetical protein